MLERVTKLHPQSPRPLSFLTRCKTPRTECGRVTVTPPSEALLPPAQHTKFLMKYLNGKHQSTATLPSASRLRATKNQGAAFIVSLGEPVFCAGCELRSDMTEKWPTNGASRALLVKRKLGGIFFFLLAFPPLYLSYADTRGRWGGNQNHVKFWKIFSHMKIKWVVWVFVKQLLKACFPM